ncbi:MAG: hypothetical protein ACM3XO_08305 [Bacteroidota bacterium]
MTRTNKDVFLARLMRERDKFELLINRIGFTRRLTIPGVLGKWSTKDLLAHVLVYEQYMADRMQEIQNGESYLPCKTQNALDAFLDLYGYPDFGSPLLDDETPMEWVVEKYKHVSLEDIIIQELNAFASIVASLERMNEETIGRHNLYERIASNTYKHYREHIRNIRSWLMVNTPHHGNSQ